VTGERKPTSVLELETEIKAQIKLAQAASFRNAFVRFPVRIPAETPTILSELLRGFTQFLQESSASVLQIRPRLLPFKLSSYHSLLNLLQSSLAVAWQRLPTVDVSLPLGSRTVPVPQVPASQSNNSEQLNPSGYLIKSLTHQPTKWLLTCHAYNISAQKTPFFC
jgi:hypothetical protein